MGEQVGDHPDSTQRSAFVIVEPDPSGHRLWFVRILLDAIHAAEPDATTYVCTTIGARNSVEWDTHLGNLAGTAIPHIIDTKPGWRRGVLKWAGQLRPGLVVIPEADRWGWQVALRPRRFAFQISALIMRPEAQHGPIGRLKHIYKKASWRLASVRNGVRIFALTFGDGSESPGWATALPDPVHLAWSGDREQGRSELSLDSDTFVSLVIGDISERKGVSEILAAWSDVDSPKSRLVFAGTIDERFQAPIRALAQADQRVTPLPGYMADKSFDQWIACVDQVLALHSNVGSSGVALKAAHSGTPVVVWRGSYLERALATMDCAAVISVDPASLPAALRHRGSPKTTAARVDAGRQEELARGLLLLRAEVVGHAPQGIPPADAPSEASAPSDRHSDASQVAGSPSKDKG